MTTKKTYQLWAILLAVIAFACLLTGMGITKITANDTALPSDTAYAETTYTVTDVTTLANQSLGSVTISKTSNLKEGDEVQLTVVPNQGYAIKMLEIWNASIFDTYYPTTSSSKYNVIDFDDPETMTFTMPAGNVKFEVSFATAYKVNLEEAVGGTYSFTLQYGSGIIIKDGEYYGSGAQFVPHIIKSNEGFVSSSEIYYTDTTGRHLNANSNYVKMKDSDETKYGVMFASLQKKALDGGSIIPKSTATEIYFGTATEYATEIAGKTLIDTSENTTVSSDIKVYRDGTKYYIVSASNGKIIFPMSLSSAFSGYTAMEKVVFGTNVDFSNVVTTSNMFKGETALKTVEFKGTPDLSLVQNINSMFYNCTALGTLTFGGMPQFSSLISAKAMFQGCSALDVDISLLSSAEKCTTFDSCFSGSGITVADFSSFEISPVASMEYMFFNCTKLTTIKFGKLFFKKATAITQLFKGCTELTSVDFSGVEIDSATTFTKFFNNCSKLESVDFSDVKAPKVANLANMFDGCTVLKDVNFSGCTFGTITNINYMFSGCTGLEVINLSDLSLATANLNITNMFNGCTALKTIKVSDAFASATSNASTHGNAFAGCTKLVGGNGTTFDENYIDKTYARIDVEGTKGYFTRANAITNLAPKADSATNHGSIAVVTSAITGQEVLVTANPESGYYTKTILIYKTGDNTKISVATLDANNKFTMPDYDITIEATFAEITYTITDVTTSANQSLGSVTISKTSNLKEGDEVQLTVVPNQGYAIRTLKIWNTSINATYTYSISSPKYNVINFDDPETMTFTMPAGDVKIDVSFATAYKVNLEEAVGGTYSFTLQYGSGIIIKDGEYYGRGATLVRHITTPNEGFIFSSEIYYTDTAGRHLNANSNYVAVKSSDETKYGVIFASLQKSTLTGGSIIPQSTATEIYFGTATEYATEIAGKTLIDTSENTTVSSDIQVYQDGTKYYIVSASNGKILFPMSLKGAFSEYNAMEKIVFGENVDFSNVISMYLMFNGRSKLKTVIFKGTPDFSRVQETSSMFYNCTGLSTLTFGKTPQFISLLSATSMFYNCSALDVDISWLGSLKKIDGIHYCFKNSGITTADLSSFEISTNADIHEMFAGCTKLTDVKIGKTFFKNVSNVSQLFAGCTELISVDFSGAEFDNATTFTKLFNNCSKLESVDFSDVKAPNVTDLSDMFGGCTVLKDVNFSGCTFGTITNINYMFSGCTGLEVINLSDLSLATANLNITNMFKGCTALKTIKVSNAFASATSNAILHDGVFAGCTKLVGGNGTTFDENYIDKTYARIDVEGTKGYFTLMVYSVTYDKNAGTDSVTGMPSDTTKYWENAPVTVSTDTPTRAGYKFLGWNTDKTATTALTFTDGKFDMGKKDVTLYAVWKNMKYDSDITITITTLEYGVKESDISISVDDTDLTVLESDLFKVGKTAMEYPEKIEKPGTYYIAFVLKSTEGYYFGGEKYFDRYEEDINKKFFSLFKKTITIEGSNMFAGYGCKVYDVTNVIFYSDITDQTEIIEVNNQYLFVMVEYVLPGYTVTYDENAGTDTVSGMPSDTTEYLENAPVTVSTDTPTRAGYKFLGWNTDKDATTALTFTDGKFDMGDEDVTLYAIWESLEYNKALTLTVTTLEYDLKSSDIEITVSDSDLEVVEYALVFVDYVAHANIAKTSVDVPGEYGIFVVLQGKTENYWFKSKGNEYYNNTITVANSTFAMAFSCDTYTIESIYYTYGTETNVVKNKYLLVAMAYELPGYTVTYDENAGTDTVSGMPSDTTEYLENAPVTVKTDTPIRVGYKFLGWNTDKDATTALTFTDGKFDMGDEDVTLYAIWEEKTAVTITETAQTFTYDGTAQSFDIVGSTLTGFTVEYYVSSAWTETAPTDAGTYNVKVTRAEDDDYKSFSKEITGGLVINKKDITLTITDVATGTYTYDGTEKTTVATYTTLVGTDELSYTLSYDDNVNAGTCTVTIDSASISKGTADNYNLITTDTGSLVIDKSAVSEPTVGGTYAYNGEEQTVTLNGVETFMDTESSLTETDADDYSIVFTLDDNHTWAEGSDGTVIWTIAKATTVIDVDTSDIEITFGESVTLPTASSNWGEVTCDTLATDLVHADEYTITYSVEETDNYLGAEETLTVLIKKLAVREPTITGSYKYTGEVQIPTIEGLESYMSHSGTLSATEAGVYEITVSLDDDYEWAEGSDGILTWEIKALKKETPTEKKEDKPQVIIETQDGFPSDIVLEVVVVTESTVIEASKKKDLMVDYYNLSNETIALTEDEVVGLVYEIKLVQNINGELKELQPEDIAPGTKITVRMLIPEEVDTTKLIRILHVHSADDIEEYKFDPSKMDENRYYEIEIDKFSEFAFICEKEEEIGIDSCTNHWYILGMVLAIAVLMTLGIFFNRSKKITIVIILDMIALLLLISILFLIACTLCKIFFVLGIVSFAVGLALQIVSSLFLKKR